MDARKNARKLSRAKNDLNASSAKKVYNKLTQIIREEIQAIKNKEWCEFI